MTSEEWRPPYLPPKGQWFGSVIGGSDRWSAVSVPMNWGHLVVGALGDVGGPAYDDGDLNRVMWFLPPGGGADWLNVPETGIAHHAPGEKNLMPGPESCASMGWLRYPVEGLTFTDPAALRLAVATVIGPLEEAVTSGP